MHVAAISRELRISQVTARRHFHAADVDELVAALQTGWPSILNEYDPYLHQRRSAISGDQGDGLSRPIPHRPSLRAAVRPGSRATRRSLRTACPHLASLHGHIAEFATLLTGRLDTWIAAVLPDLHAFVNGLERDYAAVLNELTLPYSTGAVEGKLCKIKILKGLMFGRANYDLVRKMALLN